MIISKVISKVLPLVLKEVLKAVMPELKPLKKYVFQKNELDKKCEEFESRLRELEDNSHPKRDFIECDTCKKKVKEKGKWYEK